MVEHKEFKESEGGRMNNEQGICPTCNRVRIKPHIEVEGTKIWRDEVLEKRFRNISAEICVRMRSGCVMKCSSRNSEYMQLNINISGRER
jgi:hypothetical protein